MVEHPEVTISPIETRLDTQIMFEKGSLKDCLRQFRDSFSLHRRLLSSGMFGDLDVEACEENCIKNIKYSARQNGETNNAKGVDQKTSVTRSQIDNIILENVKALFPNQALPSKYDAQLGQLQMEVRIIRDEADKAKSRERRYTPPTLMQRAGGVWSKAKTIMGDLLGPPPTAS